MGEAAEIALHGEMFGIDDPFEAMVDYYNSQTEPKDIQIDLQLTLASLDEWIDEDEPISRAEVLQSMFESLTGEEAQGFITVAEKIAAMKLEDVDQ